MFSYAVLRRGEIALALSDWYGLRFPGTEVFEAWQSVGDVVRYIVAHAEPPVAEAEALRRVRCMFGFGWAVPPEAVTPEAELFGPALRLHCRDFFPDDAPPVAER